MNRRIASPLLALLVITAVACDGPGRMSQPLISGAPSVSVSGTELRFTPTQIRIPADQVNLTFRNDGATDHDLTIPQLGVQLVARPGRAASTGLRGLRPGRYAALCTVSGHAEAGMRMTVIVE